jgi:hypothetical protein
MIFRQNGQIFFGTLALFRSALWHYYSTKEPSPCAPALLPIVYLDFMVSFNIGGRLEIREGSACQFTRTSFLVSMETIKINRNESTKPGIKP